MGLFDKIKDNAREISVRAIEGNDQYADDQSAGYTVVPNDQTDQPVPDTQDQFQGEETPLEVMNEVVEEVIQETEASQEPVTEEKSDKAQSKPKTDDKPKEEKPKEEAKKETKPSKPAETPKLNGKPYTPSYKQKSTGKAPRVIDISPQRSAEPEKRIVYERERAIMATLASQRRLDGTTPLYVTTHLRFKTRVFINRIEYSGSFGKNVIPIEQIAWVKLRAGGTGVILETVEGKRIVMVIKPADRLNFAEAIIKVQSMQPKKEKFKDTKTVRLDQLEKMEEGIDEIEKLARLLDKGILTQEEFDAKKKQILGI